MRLSQLTTALSIVTTSGSFDLCFAGRVPVMKGGAFHAF